ALKAEAAAITLQRLRQIIEGGLVDDAGGRRRFHFEAADGRISFLNVSEIIGLQLERGKVAIVQQPEDAELHVLVTRDAAIKVTEVEPQLLRFLVRN
ncbi:MAG: DUF2058 family protein, partial [Myxococcota bacterium]|nr:DUF2058 family protein [Myxococcota bacterium]